MLSSQTVSRCREDDTEDGTGGLLYRVINKPSGTTQDIGAVTRHSMNDGDSIPLFRASQNRYHPDKPEEINRNIAGFCHSPKLPDKLTNLQKVWSVDQLIPPNQLRNSKKSVRKRILHEERISKSGYDVSRHLQEIRNKSALCDGVSSPLRKKIRNNCRGSFHADFPSSATVDSRLSSAPESSFTDSSFIWNHTMSNMASLGSPQYPANIPLMSSTPVKNCALFSPTSLFMNNPFEAKTKMPSWYESDHERSSIQACHPGPSPNLPEPGHMYPGSTHRFQASYPSHNPPTSSHSWRHSNSFSTAFGFDSINEEEGDGFRSANTGEGFVLAERARKRFESSDNPRIFRPDNTGEGFGTSDNIESHFGSSESRFGSSKSVGYSYDAMDITGIPRDRRIGMHDDYSFEENRSLEGIRRIQNEDIRHQPKVNWQWSDLQIKVDNYMPLPDE